MKKLKYLLIGLFLFTSSLAYATDEDDDGFEDVDVVNISPETEGAVEPPKKSRHKSHVPIDMYDEALAGVGILLISGYYFYLRNKKIAK